MEETARRRFVFDACLGRGGFGEVYRAKMASPGGLESTVAVKVLRSELSDADAIRRLRDEGRLLARLNHPTILKVYDLVFLEGRVAMVAEFVDGADLGALTPNLPVRAQLQVIGGVAAALHAAWSTPGLDGAPLQLVHRDIKPTNIRVGRHGEIKLLDFGIAHFQGEDREAKTASDVIVGSLPYMAPERFLERRVRSASDVFALGCSLYEGLVGERFFAEGQLRRMGALALDDALFDAHVADRLALVPDSVPEPVAALLVELLAHDADARVSAQALASRCEQLAEDMGGVPLRRWCRERAWTEAPAASGPLVGRTILEGTLASMPNVGRLAGPTGRPSVHRAAVETLDPTVEPGFVPPPPRPSPPPLPPDPPRPAPRGSAGSKASRAAFAVAGCGGLGLAIGVLVSAIIVVAAVAVFLSGF